MTIGGGAHVMADELEAGVAKPVADVGLGAREEVVHADHLVVFLLQEPVDQVRADEATAARHEDPGCVALDRARVGGD